jgi:hypothetical protein
MDLTHCSFEELSEVSEVVQGVNVRGVDPDYEEPVATPVLPQGWS